MEKSGVDKSWVEKSFSGFFGTKKNFKINKYLPLKNSQYRKKI